MADLTPKESSQPRRTPLPHQIAALRAWEASGSRGILEHATGSGKTVTALTAIERHLERGGVALVLVPSRLLLKQWAKEITAAIPDAVMLSAGAGNNSWRESNRLGRFTSPDPTLGKRIVLSTMQTAATDLFRSMFQQGPHLLIVADEVHQVGSEQNSRALSIDAGPRLGLSATPRRYGDSRGTDRLLHYFGPVVQPPFTLEDAISAGRLVQYVYEPHIVRLDHEESIAWRELTHRIAREVGHGSESGIAPRPLSERARRLLIERSRIAKKAREKIAVASDVLRAHFHAGQRWLVYCEDSDQLTKVRDRLHNENIDSQEYHTQMLADGDATLTWFRHHGGVLLAIRCLDEGVDIPEISHALILASSQNPRQFIQRRGRVLRVAEGKSIAVVHDALVVPDDTEFEPAQTALAKAELRRAIDFAGSAINRSAEAHLREIAIKLGMDLDSLYDCGIEVEEEDADR